MNDLDNLIEAVEAGFPDYALLEYDGFCDTFRQDFRDAYHGSLDSAKALHEALLPGWTRDVDATAPDCGITVTLHKPYLPHRSPDDMGVVSADMPCEPRAWLIAVLKAYRAQRETEQ